jgi:hypothetical protein
MKQLDLPLDLPPKEKQFPLPLEETPDNWTAEKLTSLEREELAKIYKSLLGINPLSRSFDTNVIIQGILNPNDEAGRLRDLDRIDDAWADINPPMMGK